MMPTASVICKNCMALWNAVKRMCCISAYDSAAWCKTVQQRQWSQVFVIFTIVLHCFDRHLGLENPCFVLLLVSVLWVYLRQWCDQQGRSRCYRYSAIRVLLYRRKRLVIWRRDVSLCIRTTWVRYVAESDSDRIDQHLPNLCLRLECHVFLTRSVCVHVSDSMCEYLSTCLSVCMCVCDDASAADEYILRHFDNAMTEAHVDIKLLRVCDTERSVRTVSATVQKYCLMTRDKRHFVSPTCDDIKEHHVVVTTLVTSLGLHRLNVTGAFTHIFVDEAAQVGFQ